MSSKIEQQLNEYLRIRTWMEGVFVDAGRAERFLAKPNNNRCPSMYQCLETYYDKRDWGYHVKPVLKLRATPQQIQNYSTAIDLLLAIDKLDNRKIVWLKATRNSYSQIGRYLGYHRTTVKRIYDNVLDDLVNKIKSKKLDIYDRKSI